MTAINGDYANFGDIVAIDLVRTSKNLGSKLNRP